MRPLLIAEVLGLENVNNGFGFLLVFFGIATFFANPLAGTFVVLFKPKQQIIIRMNNWNCR